MKITKGIFAEIVTLSFGLFFLHAEKQMNLVYVKFVRAS
jgi:hypothetical protein